MKGKKHVGNGNVIPEIKLDYKKTGTKIPKRLKTPPSYLVLVRNLRTRFVNYILLRCSVESLDKAIKAKTGKAHSRGAVSRSHAKGYNEGYQQALQEYEGRWL